MAERAAGSAPSHQVLLVVAAALVERTGRVLVQRRPLHKQHGGLWEFPGGKIELGESPEAALARELAEELGIGIDPAEAAPVAFASRDDHGRHLVLLLYRVARWSGEPRAIEAMALAWRSIDRLDLTDMPPADRELARALRRDEQHRG